MIGRNALIVSLLCFCAVGAVAQVNPESKGEADRIGRDGGRVRVNSGGAVDIITPSGKQITLKGISTFENFLESSGITAPAVAPVGRGRIYFDSPSNKYRVSQNGGAYADLVTLAGAAFTGTVTAPNINDLSIGGMPVLVNPTIKPIFISGAASGNVDLYTVPSGKRAMLAALFFSNQTAGTLTLKTQVKISGTYYRLSASSSAATLVSNNLSTSAPYIAEAGEILAINTTGAGLNVWARIIEFDDTTSFKSVKNLALASGNNTIYTCPGGKTAAIMQANPVLVGGATTFYANDSGSSVTPKWYIVPSGGSAGDGNLFFFSSAVATATTQAATSPTLMSAGDFVVLNLSASGSQWAWINVIEK